MLTSNTTHILKITKYFSVNCVHKNFIMTLKYSIIKIFNRSAEYKEDNTLYIK